MKIRVQVVLATCKRCGGPKNNPLTHRCVVSFRDLAARSATGKRKR